MGWGGDAGALYVISNGGEAGVEKSLPYDLICLNLVVVRFLADEPFVESQTPSARNDRKAYPQRGEAPPARRWWGGNGSRNLFSFRAVIPTARGFYCGLRACVSPWENAMVWFRKQISVTEMGVGALTDLVSHSFQRATSRQGSANWVRSAEVNSAARMRLEDLPLWGGGSARRAVVGGTWLPLWGSSREAGDEVGGNQAR